MYSKMPSRKLFKERTSGSTLTQRTQSSTLNQGFTMIELLIVIVSISLLFSLGYASYRSYARRQTVESFARQIRSDLRLSQELATSGKKPASGCSSLDGYEFDIQETLQQYEIEAVCGGSATGSPEKVVSVPSGLVVRATGGTGDTALFKILGRGTNIPSGTPLLIEVGQTAQLAGACQTTPWDTSCTYLNPVTVTVTSTGEIY